MNWKIIFQLSIFGLIMAFATVSLIPQKIEPAFWLPIFLFSAYVIAKVCTGNYFLHGLFVSLVNCIWIIAVHAGFYITYAHNHREAASMGASILPASIAIHPRLSMIVIGPFIGLLSGIILGLFSLVASKIVKRNA